MNVWFNFLLKGRNEYLTGCSSWHSIALHCLGEQNTDLTNLRSQNNIFLKCMMCWCWGNNWSYISCHQNSISPGFEFILKLENLYKNFFLLLHLCACSHTRPCSIKSVWYRSSHITCVESICQVDCGFQVYFSPQGIRPLWFQQSWKLMCCVVKQEWATDCCWWIIKWQQTKLVI